MYDVEPKDKSTIRVALKGLKGSLVSISDASEQEHIYDLLTAYDEGEYAIGLQNAGAHGIVWSDGNSATYRNFGPAKRGINF